MHQRMATETAESPCGTGDTILIIPAVVDMHAQSHEKQSHPEQTRHEHGQTDGTGAYCSLLNAASSASF